MNAVKQDVEKQEKKKSVKSVDITDMTHRAASALRKWRN